MSVFLKKMHTITLINAPSHFEPSSTPSSSDPPSSNKVFKKGEYLELDPGKRTPIFYYHPNDQDEVRRVYLVNGPTRPNTTDYPPRKIGKRNRSFNNSWYKDNDWLEYSIEKVVVFCLPCYLCYNGTSNSAFVIEGFRCWNLKDKLNTRVGELNSHHRNCHSTKAEADYLVRVKASLEAVKFLVRCGIAFRAQNEGGNSIYKGHFLEFIEALGRNNEKIAEAFKSGGGNCKMTSPIIQKELANACAVETVKKIVEEIGDGFFSVLVDESGDCSGKEQMAVVVRFIDDRGFIVERFIGIVHVEDTSVKAFKDALETLLSGFGLCISKIRGQGYDGASNMKGQFGGLKTLIQKENPQAYYVHCFAHQLQLALISMARKHEDVDWFFLEVSRIVNFLRSSNKRQSLLRKKQVAHFSNLIEDELVETGTSLNQELSIARAGDTYLLFVMQTFGFVFMLYLMVEVLSLTNDLSQALQKGDQDIVTAMQLVQVSKKMLQQMTDNGWEAFYEKMVDSCGNLEIDVPNMESRYVKGNKSKRLAPLLTNLNYFKNDCFLHVIDFIIKELGDRFTPENVELLNCVACLNPYSSFQDFDIKSLVRLARFYPNDFENVSDNEFSNQLETYIDVERVFSGMKYVKNELRNRMANSWLNDCLVAFVEKEVFITVDGLDIIKRFQDMSKRRLHLRLD
ncbi:hypothetical protein ABFS83_10G111200 [Erythranthe nasuta]